MNWSKINLLVAEGFCVLGVFCTALMVMNPAYMTGLMSAIVVCAVLMLISLWFAKITYKRK